MSFCRSLLGLLTIISRTSCPLLGISTTKNTRSSRSLVTALIVHAEETHEAATHGYAVSSEKITIWHRYVFILHLLSFCVMVPFSSFPAIEANTLLASLAKSRSLTSAGETGTMAKASLSSLCAEVPIFNQKRETQYSRNCPGSTCLNSHPKYFGKPIMKTAITHLLWKKHIQDT